MTQYKIERKPKYTGVLLVIALVLLVVPILVSVLLSDIRFAMFSMIGILLLVYVLYAFYIAGCYVLFDRINVAVKKPFRKKTYAWSEVHWEARKLGFANPYYIIFIKHQSRTVMRINTDWINFECVLMLKNRSTLTKADRDFIRLAHRNDI